MTEWSNRLVLYGLLAIPIIGALLWLWTLPFGPILAITAAIVFAGAFALAERGS